MGQWDLTEDYSASHAIGLGCSHVGAQRDRNGSFEGGSLRCPVPWQGRLGPLGLSVCSVPGPLLLHVASPCGFSSRVAGLYMTAKISQNCKSGSHYIFKA